MDGRVVTLDLGDGMTLAAFAEASGPELVADRDIVATLEAVTGPIERVGRAALEAVRRTGPTKASVELSFGLTIEQGQLLALLGKGKGEAAITVVLEWEADAGGQGADQP
jgi:hypothetical protein